MYSMKLINVINCTMTIMTSNRNQLDADFNVEQL